MPETQAQAPKPRKRGFSTVEILIASALMAMVFLGAIALFSTTTMTAAKVSAAKYAAVSSAQATQYVCDEIKEAYAAVLPSGNKTLNSASWEPGNTHRFISSTSKNTGVYLYAPPAANIPLESGNLQIMDRTARGVPLCLIYRGDKLGNADPNAGTCLWRQDAITNARTLLIDNISKNPNAVFFEIAQDGLSKAVEVKIVCGEWSYLGNEQTSDTWNVRDGSGGYTNQTRKIGGRVVTLRNSAISTVGVTTGGIGPSEAPNDPPPPPTPTPDPNATPVPPAPTPVPPTPTPTRTPTPVPTPTPTRTPTPIPTPTRTPTPTPRPTPTPTRTPTPIPTPTRTPTPTPRPTPTPTRPPLFEVG